MDSNVVTEAYHATVLSVSLFRTRNNIGQADIDVIEWEKFFLH